MISDENKFLESRILDLAEASEKHYTPKFTMFLDERQSHEAGEIIKRLHYDGRFMKFGGYGGALRVMLGCFPKYSELCEDEFPVTPVCFKFRKGTVGHRDVLGSLMALNIKRESVGDILIYEDDGEAVAFLSSAVVPVVLDEIKKIGSEGVLVSVPEGRRFVRLERFEEIEGTAASLRLDCILALALKQSREKTSALIRSSGVDLNYNKEFSPSKELHEGDVFSVRGYGKFIFHKIGGTSKKNRIFVIIKKYL